MKPDTAMTEGFEALTDILKGMTKHVPARMAIETVLTTISRQATVRWCALSLPSLQSHEQLAVAGVEPPAAERVDTIVARWATETSGSPLALIHDREFNGAAPGQLYGMEVLDARGVRCGWFLCFCRSEPTRDFESLLRMVSWLVAATLEQDRMRARMVLLEQRHLSIIESLPHVVYEGKLDGGLTFISHKISRLTGFQSSELTDSARAFAAIIHPEDRDRRRVAIEALRPRLQELLLGESRELGARSGTRREMVEYRLIHRNERDIIWVADHFVLRMENPDETRSGSLEEGDFVVMGVLVDVSERKRLEIEALQRSRLATIGELAAGVAHEVNNPLTAVLTYGQMLERWLRRQRLTPEERAKGESYVENIIEQGRAIKEITRNLTGFVKKEESEKFAKVSPAQLITTSLSIFRFHFKKERIQLRIEASVDLPPMCARAREIRQVVLNLVANARASLNTRFPIEEGPHKNKLIIVSACLLEDEGNYIRISLTDFGEGIPAPNMEKIFDAFFTTRQEGTGLGLSIATRIVEEHKGRLLVESDAENGTSFHLDIPVWVSSLRSGSGALAAP